MQGWTLLCWSQSSQPLNKLVGYESNVPLQHKNKLYLGQGLGWRFSSIRLRVANDTVTSWPHCLFVQQWPEREKDRGGLFTLLC